MVVPNIQICINRYLVSRRFARSPYSIIFPFWLIGYVLLAWSVPRKLTAGKIHARDKTCQHWVVGAPCALIDWLIDWFRNSKSWCLHWSGRVTQDSSNCKRNVWTLVIRRGSIHSEISKTAMFDRRLMGSPILNIFESNLLQWFYN